MRGQVSCCAFFLPSCSRPSSRRPRWPSAAWRSFFGADRYATLRPLANAVNDARAVEDALTALGFEVYFESNRDLERMRGALADFREEASGADVALVFFAGHGVEIGGENRLLPTDADPSSLERLKDTSLPLEELRETVEAVADVGLIVLDACRNDPFGPASPGDGRGATALDPHVRAAAKPGLGRVGRSENVLFAFSAAPGQTAADGNGRNSPFTAALTKYLPTDGLEIRSVLTLVQQEVYDLSGGSQLPYVESGLPALFFAAAKGDLPERERLLLAMADVSPALRDEVERVAADHQMPLAPLYGALVENRLGDLPAEERGVKLAEAARSFVETREKLRTFASSDEAVTRLRAEAERALSLGAFAEATTRLDDAIAVDGKAAEAVGAVFVERTVSKAGSLAARAGVERTELRYAAAIASLEEAAAEHDGIAALDVPDAARDARVWVLADIGDLHVLTGDTARALDAYRRMQGAAELRLAHAPAEADAERDISVSHDIGDVHMDMGDLASALDAYEASLTIRESLVARDSDNAGWQRDLSGSHARIGDVLRVQGDLKGALEAYQATLTTSASLAAREPGNTKWQRNLAVSHDKLGDVRVALGDLAGALADYETSHAIRASLAALDPENIAWQRGLAVSRSKIGDVREAQGNLAGALEDQRAVLAIIQSVAASDLGNTMWQDDLSVGHDKVGNLLKAQGSLADALAAYEAAFAIRDALVKRDPGNAKWQRRLAQGHSNIGDVHMAAGDLKGAVGAYQASLGIAERLVALDPGNTHWLNDLAYDYARTGDALAAQGNVAEALPSYTAALAIRERLAMRDPGNVEWQWGLFVAYWNMATSTNRKAEFFAKALPVLEMLQTQGKLSPSRVEWIGRTRAELAKLEPAASADQHHRR